MTVTTRAHIVQLGESTDSIAFQHGHFPLTVWNDASNAELRGRRESRNVLAEGDVLYIPPLRPKQAAVNTGAVHRFRRRGVPSKLRLRLLDADKPLAQTAYTLTLAGEAPRHGTTDADGVLDEWVSPEATRAELCYGPRPTRVPLALGHLDPISSTRGRQQRLNNLGYPCGRTDGVLDEATRGAMRAFQAAMQLVDHGHFDEGSVAALASAHDARGNLPPKAR